MKNPSVFGLGMLCVGIGIGWLIKPNGNAEKHSVPISSVPGKSSSEKSASPSSAVPGLEMTRKRVEREPSVSITKKESTEFGTEEFKKMQADGTRAIIQSQSAQLEQYLQRRGDALNLSAEQKLKMTAWMDEILKKMDAINPNDPEAVGEAMIELSPHSFDEELAKLLTDDQKSAFSAIADKERQSKIDSTALKSLAKLQGIIDFEEGQRDEVYKILTTSAEKKILNESQHPELNDLQLSAFDMDMDPYDLGLMQSMSGQATLPGQPTKTMKEIIEDRIEAKVNELRPVLNASQLEQYRAELKSKGLGIFGNAMMNCIKEKEVGVSFLPSSVEPPASGHVSPSRDK